MIYRNLFSLSNYSSKCTNLNEVSIVLLCNSCIKLLFSFAICLSLTDCLANCKIQWKDDRNWNTIKMCNTADRFLSLVFWRGLEPTPDTDLFGGFCCSTFGVSHSLLYPVYVFSIICYHPFSLKSVCMDI